MADSKEEYSTESKDFIARVPTDKPAEKEYERSKKREAKYNERWKKQKVNLNEVVDTFAPDATIRKEKGKLIYEGERYNVLADMSAGYLRIWDKETEQYVTLDGAPDPKYKNGHYKIMRREEM